MDKVVVIGATGNTGAYLTEDLCRHSVGRDFEVIAAGRRDTRFFDKYGIQYVSIDICDRSSLARLPKSGVKAVVMLAGVLPAHMRGYDPMCYIDVNVRGGLNVLEYCREAGVERILYAQTISDVLGAVGPESPFIRFDQARSIILEGDHAVYALSKSFIVDLIEHYRQDYGLKGFVFRLPTVYAATAGSFYYVDGVRRKLGYRILMEKAMNGEPLEIWGDPARAKDVVGVKDFCQMLRKAVLVEGVDGGVFNVGTGVGTTTEEWVRGIADVFNPVDKKSDISFRPDMPHGPSYIMDISNARDLLGYEPEYKFRAFLQDFKAEMVQDRFRDLRSERS